MCQRLAGAASPLMAILGGVIHTSLLITGCAALPTWLIMLVIQDFLIHPEHILTTLTGQVLAKSHVHVST